MTHNMPLKIKKEKTNGRSTNRAFIWISLAIVLAVILSFQIWQNIQQNKQLEQKIVEAREKNQFVKNKQTELQLQLDLLNDDQYILKLARVKGFFSRSNEIIFNLPIDNNILKAEKNREEHTQQK